MHFFPSSAPSMDTTLCEGQKKTISCPDEHSIKIMSAMYGRQSATPCSSGQSAAKLKNTRCSRSSVYYRLRRSCNGRTRCELYSHNSVFGDPCSDTFKYLQVNHKCVRNGEFLSFCNLVYSTQK